MKLHPKRAVAAVGAVAIAAGVTLATAGTAFAVAPYNPDASSVGSITFTDANGVPVTTGSTGSPIAAFVAGSKLVDAGDADGSLGVYLPAKGVNPALWSGEAVGLDTVFNPAPVAWPADLKSLVTAGKPVINERSTDLSPATFAADFPNTATVGPNSASAANDPAWQNLYQLRFFNGTNTAQYDSADIVISGSTWTLVPNPTQTISTTTALSASPANPDITAANPAPVTLTTTVTPASAIPAGYIGGIGTVVVKDGATVVDTEIIAPSSASPYTVTTNLSLGNPSTHSYTATFTPFNGTALLGSASTALPYTVSVPLPTANTTLAAVWQPFAGGSTPTHFSGNVTGNGATPPPVTAGTVNLFDNGSSTPLNSSPLTVGAGGAFSADIIIATAGPHSVVATFTDPGVYVPSNSSPVTQTLGTDPNATCAAPGHPTTGAGSCTDPQTITGTVPAGTLAVSTPYTAAHPFNVGTLALDGSGTILTSHALFGGAGLDPTNANADIIVTDTRAGNLNWTLQAQSTNLQDATSDVINGQNVGLTGLGSHPAPGFNTGGLVGFDNPAANGVAPADPGNLGLGGSIKHDVAQATHGIGTVGIYGTLTLNAPTSTPAGIYTGTLTFTIVGSLV